MAILDLRRSDQRSNIRANPFWITSAEINKDADDTEAVLMSFPLYGGDFIIQNMMLDVITDYTAGTVAIEIGYGTIATDLITTGGTITETDDDEYWASFDPTAGRHFPLSTLTDGTPNTQTGTDFAIARTKYGGSIIVGADADVPCIYCKLVSDDVLTAGAARLHVLVSQILKGT